MLPDSTVKDPKKPRKKKKVREHVSDEVVNTSLKKVRKKSDSSAHKKPPKKKVKKKADIDAEGSDMDLEKELHPISYYIKDRREMVRQMFGSLKKSKIESMLPEILKKYAVAEVEEFCCDQIEVMSKKRILGLIEGREADDISSSGTEDNSEDDVIVTLEKVQVDVDPPDSTVGSVDIPNIEEELERMKPQSLAVAMGSHHSSINKQKLEILELEMRARAIKRMLQSQQPETLSEDESNTQVVENDKPTEQTQSWAGGDSSTPPLMVYERSSRNDGNDDNTPQVDTPMSETKCIEQNLEVNEGRRNSLVIDGSSKLTDKIYTQQLPSCSEIEAGEMVDVTDCHHHAETTSAGSECSGNSSAIASQSLHNLNQRSPLVISSDEDCENELPSSKDILIPDHGKKDNQLPCANDGSSSGLAAPSVDDKDNSKHEETVEKTQQHEIQVSGSSSRQDIFENIEIQIKLDNVMQKENSEVEAKATFDSKAPMHQANSTLYEDVPSPGKFEELSDKTVVVSQSDVETINDKKYNALLCQGVKTLSAEVTPVVSTSTVDWFAELDDNVNDIDREVMEDEKVEAESNSCASKEKTRYLDDIVIQRAPTPEITAQRYRSRDISDVLRGVSESTLDIISSKTQSKRSKSDKSSKVKTKRVKKREKVLPQPEERDSHVKSQFFSADVCETGAKGFAKPKTTVSSSTQVIDNSPCTGRPNDKNNAAPDFSQKSSPSLCPSSKESNISRIRRKVSSQKRHQERTLSRSSLAHCRSVSPKQFSSHNRHCSSGSRFHEKTDTIDTTSEYYSHDGHVNSTHRPHKRDTDTYSRPKRMHRSEWESTSKVTAIESKLDKISTSEQLPSRGSRTQNSLKRKITNRDRKSPIRFPSPDIEVLKTKGVGKSPPMLVVLSDSD